MNQKKHQQRRRRARARDAFGEGTPDVDSSRDDTTEQWAEEGEQPWKGEELGDHTPAVTATAIRWPIPWDELKETEVVVLQDITAHKGCPPHGEGDVTETTIRAGTRGHVYNRKNISHIKTPSARCSKQRAADGTCEKYQIMFEGSSFDKQWVYRTDFENGMIVQVRHTEGSLEATTYMPNRQVGLLLADKGWTVIRIHKDTGAVITSDSNRVESRWFCISGTLDQVRNAMKAVERETQGRHQWCLSVEPSADYSGTLRSVPYWEEGQHGASQAQAISSMSQSNGRPGRMGNRSNAHEADDRRPAKQARSTWQVTAEALRNSAGMLVPRKWREPSGTTC